MTRQQDNTSFQMLPKVVKNGKVGKRCHILLKVVKKCKILSKLPTVQASKAVKNCQILQQVSKIAKSVQQRANIGTSS